MTTAHLRPPARATAAIVIVGGGPTRWLAARLVAAVVRRGPRAVVETWQIDPPHLAIAEAGFPQPHVACLNPGPRDGTMPGCEGRRDGGRHPTLMLRAPVAAASAPMSVEAPPPSAGPPRTSLAWCALLVRRAQASAAARRCRHTVPAAYSLVPSITPEQLA